MSEIPEAACFDADQALQAKHPTEPSDSKRIRFDVLIKLLRLQLL